MPETSSVRERIGATLCYHLARRLLTSPDAHLRGHDEYRAWRGEAAAQHLSHFDPASYAGREVLDFGCGYGALALHLARDRAVARVVGVDLDRPAIASARTALAHLPASSRAIAEFTVGGVHCLPLADRSVDTIFAFDCVEHLMAPAAVMAEWFRVLRPGGRCLVVWYPYRGPWGSHMNAIVPIPWAPFLFGERALFRAAERLYDSPEYVPRLWDFDANGEKGPNRWARWSSFAEQGHLNQLRFPQFIRLASAGGLRLSSSRAYGFQGHLLRRALAGVLRRLPWLGEFFVSYYVIEMCRP